jgi:hypothetical protein
MEQETGGAETLCISRYTSISATQCWSFPVGGEGGGLIGFGGKRLQC